MATGLTHSIIFVILALMKRRDIVIALVVLIILAGVVYYRQRNQVQEELKVPETLSIEESLEDKLNIQIPDDADKADLKDATGGSSSGIFSRKSEEGTFTSSFIADLPQPESGKYYEGWLVKGEEGSEDYSIVSAGRLSAAKGGYLLDFSSRTDYSEYNKIMVTLESKSDRTPEETVLEGNF